MNICFLNSGFPSPTCGGVEHVTYDLGTYFVKCGFSVFCVSLQKEIDCDNSLPFQCRSIPDFKSGICESNIQFWKNFLIDHKINIVIIQSEMNLALELCLNATINGVKIICTLHVPPPTQCDYYDDYMAEHFYVIRFPFNFILMPYLLVKYLYKRLNALQWMKSKLKKQYMLCNAYVTLSSNFNSELIRFLGLVDSKKLYSIPNPLVIDNFNYLSAKKQNVILWVGRMLFSQKRPDRIIKIWQQLADKYHDWCLEIVGNGPAKSILEDYCIRNNVPRVKFCGRQNPIDYYRRAKILSMTSSYEGWGLVLPEAMQYGCVPIAYNSYSSLTDIINDNVNGCIVPAFSLSKYRDRLIELMTLDNEREKLAVNACQTAQKFALDKVGEKWVQLFQQI